MKITTILFGGALIAASAVLANPIGAGKPQGHAIHKRNEALDEALQSIKQDTSEQRHHHFCYRPGETCSKARRALDELSAVHKHTASAHAAAEPPVDDVLGSFKQDISEDRHHHFCYRPGETCSKMKRAAEAAAEAMALPEALPTDPVDEVLQSFKQDTSEQRHHHFCYRPGEVCSKARRSALALAEAFPLLDGQERQFCYRSGGPCAQAKRAALAAAEAEADAFAEAQQHDSSRAKRDVNATNPAAAAAQEYCDSMAGPCAATKRFAAALADALAEPAVEPESEEEKDMQKRCYAEGGVCAINKRAVEELSAIVRAF